MRVGGGGIRDDSAEGEGQKQKDRDRQEDRQADRKTEGQLNREGIKRNAADHAVNNVLCIIIFDFPLSFYMSSLVVVAFSSRVSILGECLKIHSPPALFFSFFF